jgi:hypothetical protein
MKSGEIFIWFLLAAVIAYLSRSVKSLSGAGGTTIGNVSYAPTFDIGTGSVSTGGLEDSGSGGLPAGVLTSAGGTTYANPNSWPAFGTTISNLPAQSSPDAPGQWVYAGGLKWTWVKR